MPSRLIREGILTSDRVNQLSAEAEVFYRRLMSKVDDHGLFDARPNVLVASLYPLRRETTENTCLQLLAECIKSNLVKVYEVGGKRFLQMIDTRWKVRSEPKFPPPESADSVISCEQLLATVSLDVVVNEVVVVDVGVSTSLRSVAPEKVVLPEKQKTTTLATITSPPVPEKPNTDLNREIWEAYRGEYLKTYGAEPVRNAHTNGVIANIGKRLPAAAAPHVAAFYLSVKQPFYVKTRHSLPNLLRDCEALHTQWITGRKVTTLEARSAEHVDNVTEQIKRVGARLENRHETA